MAPKVIEMPLMSSYTATPLYPPFASTPVYVALEVLKSIPADSPSECREQAEALLSLYLTHEIADETERQKQLAQYKTP